mgnify:FL=1|jgi:UDP-N-acetylmuramyl tripeptide synthase
MQTFNSAKKLIAVCDKNGNTTSMLKKILKFCNRENYVISSTDKPTHENIQPAVLLLSDVDNRIFSNEFSVCVSDYAFSAVREISDLQPITYSSRSDEADFTAKNIRITENGYLAFEIIGVGVIGRVRLNIKDKSQQGCEEIVSNALGAASAAISCGIPFAEVLDALNNIQFDN